MLRYIYEGFSNSLAEAICCGKPVLAGDVSDNGLMVENGKNGFLFNPINVDDMAKMFCKMLSQSGSKLINMSQESRYKAVQIFDKRTYISKYLEIIGGN